MNYVIGIGSTRRGGSGGDQIQTAETLTLTTSNETSTTVFYAEFT